VPLTHDSLTAEYLAGHTAAGATAERVRETVRESVEATTYRAKSLTRPVFLGKQDYQQLIEDLSHVHDAIVAIPDRLFGGDLARFARAVGMDEREVDVVLRCHWPTPVRMSRSDVLLTADGFRMIELNMGSTMGGFDNPALNEGFLTHPYVADFASRHQLGYVDTVAELVHTILVECKVPTGSQPVMAIADLPGTFYPLEAQIRKSAGMLRRHGLDPLVCHLGQLSYSDGGVWLGEQRIDILYRLFNMEDCLSPEGRSLIDPLFEAGLRREVQIFTPMDSYLYSSKGALAILADDAYRPLLSPAERASVDRLLPWTNMVRPGPVQVHGRTVDLLEHAIAERENLVLKPTQLYGGIGVVGGWLTEPDDWRQQVEAAMDGAYVLQERVHPNVELFPGDSGLEPWALIWTQFLMTRGGAGAWVRATPGAVPSIANMNQGATATCCFVEQPNG
jgi:hypothetical protein